MSRCPACGAPLSSVDRQRLVLFRSTTAHTCGALIQVRREVVFGLSILGLVLGTCLSRSLQSLGPWLAFVSTLALLAPVALITSVTAVQLGWLSVRSAFHDAIAGYRFALALLVLLAVSAVAFGMLLPARN